MLLFIYLLTNFKSLRQQALPSSVIGSPYSDVLPSVAYFYLCSIKFVIIYKSQVRNDHILTVL
jgi:hypothetical protein